jgi:hypothetical protein
MEYDILSEKLTSEIGYAEGNTIFANTIIGRREFPSKVALGGILGISE